MDLYDRTSASDRAPVSAFRALAVRYQVVLKFFGALVLTVGIGFALRAIFENRLGQVFGAMIVWFSIIFGLLGLLFVGLFWLRGRIADYRRGG